MPLINCEIYLHLKRHEKFFLVTDTVANQVPTFTIIDTKHYVLVVNINPKKLSSARPIFQFFN